MTDGWYVAHFATDPSVLATMAVVAGLGAAAALVVPRRRAATALTGLTLAVVLGVTVVPSGGWGDLSVVPGALDSIARHLRPDDAGLAAWTSAPDAALNVALFVPLGAALTLLLHRPVMATLAATALSVAVESWQATLTTRVSSFADVVCNGLGAAAGAAVAGLALLVVRSARRA
ncbi:VanZ family protein [Modestobacter sp. NPDC049651]|uniref:VanZ family protein n=1 Tax=unclassified Modestobacter TaxID=2643866 RepID=UPI0033EEA2D3